MIPFRPVICVQATLYKERAAFHKLHPFHSSKTTRKEKFKYFCEKCDFGTFSEILFNKHKTTKKHSRYDKLEEVSDNI
jgi:hypothetical protein